MGLILLILHFVTNNKSRALRAAYKLMAFTLPNILWSGIVIVLYRSSQNGAINRWNIISIATLLILNYIIYYLEKED